MIKEIRVSRQLWKVRNSHPEATGGVLYRGVGQEGGVGAGKGREEK